LLVVIGIRSYQLSATSGQQSTQILESSPHLWEEGAPPASWLASKRQQAAALQSFAPAHLKADANHPSIMPLICDPEKSGSWSGLGLF
jgi:hypothetical protein